MTSTRKSAVVGFILMLVTGAMTGCSGPAAATKPLAAQPATVTVSGKVVESKEAWGYTYMLLENNGKKVWAAAPGMKVTPGQEVKVQGKELTQYQSKAVGRTFEKIVIADANPEGKAPAAASAPAAAPEPAVLTGKVVEVINVQTYTYILVEKDGKKGWAAIPATDVKVGDQVDLIPGVDMGEFTSATLKRTFSNIHFSGGLKKPADAAATPALPPGHPAMPGAAAAGALPQGHPKTDAPPAGAPAAASQNLITGKVVETANAGGYSYVCLEKDGKKTWAAIPATSVTVGKEMSLLPGSEMTDFNSPSLKRTFEKIIFSPGVAPAR